MFFYSVELLTSLTIAATEC